MWHSHPFTFKVARVETTYKYRGTMLFCSCFPQPPRIIRIAMLLEGPRTIHSHGTRVTYNSTFHPRCTSRTMQKIPDATWCTRANTHAGVPRIKSRNQTRFFVYTWNVFKHRSSNRPTFYWKMWLKLGKGELIQRRFSLDKFLQLRIFEIEENIVIRKKFLYKNIPLFFKNTCIAMLGVKYIEIIRNIMVFMYLL